MIKTKRRKAKRGFAAMTPERRREIARKGGQSVKPENRAFAQNRELAADAGRKGGSQSPGKRRRRRIVARRVAAVEPATVANAPAEIVAAITALLDVNEIRVHRNASVSNDPAVAVEEWRQVSPARPAAE